MAMQTHDAGESINKDCPRVPVDHVASETNQDVNNVDPNDMLATKLSEELKDGRPSDFERLETQETAKSICSGHWSKLPTELKEQILGYVLPISLAMGWARAEEMLTNQDIGKVMTVHPEMRQEMEQVLYQLNTIHLEPQIRPTTAGIPESILCQFTYRTRREGEASRMMTPKTYDMPKCWMVFRYPKRAVNCYVTRAHFHKLSVNALKDAGLTRKFAMDNTWQYLKNVTLGMYGFQSLETITVHFEAEPYRMQAFWGWNIEIDIAATTVKVSPDDEDWERVVQEAVSMQKLAIENEILAKRYPWFKLTRKEVSLEQKGPESAPKDLATSKTTAGDITAAVDIPKEAAQAEVASKEVASKKT